MYCVIIGDIVNSQELAPDVRERAVQAAKEAFHRINTKYIDTLIMTFDMVRGDAFEGVMLTQHHAPQIIESIIKAFYRPEKVTVRISVVLGELTKIGSGRNDIDGPAFHEALSRLEKMRETKNTHWLQVSFVTGSPAQPLVDSLLAQLTALTWRWTDKQREIVWAMESHGEQRKIVARQLGVSLPVVSKQLAAAHYGVYCGAWEGLTDYLANLDEYTSFDRAGAEKSYVSYFNAAVRKFEQSNYVEALPLIQKSLDSAKSELNENDPLFIPIYNKLADIYISAKEHAGAEAALEESMKLQENMPKTRLQYIKTLYFRAHIYSEKNDTGRALGNLKEALSIARSVLREKHPFLGSIYNGLAIIYRKSAEYEKAIAYYTEALATTGTSPVDYAATNYNIAKCYCRMGKNEQAFPYAEEALRLFKENLSPNHKCAADTKKLLSHIKKT